MARSFDLDIPLQEEAEGRLSDWEDKKVKIATPIKFTPKDVKSRMITVLGFQFFDTGYAFACPQCGKISGISCRKDVDKTIDWFLKFGCEHYQKTKALPSGK